ncbi:MAG TPA: hypothetical protein VHU44_09165 [Acidobacteriaceae bacterium]|jgi:hypothetical protein|nr:hypothetical protein [Acidobacteriaceae bacterium]
MSPWVPVSMAAVSIAAGFYRDWVPDVQQQKKHVRSLLNWVINVGLFGWNAWNLYDLMKSERPLTHTFVFEIAASASVLGLLAAMIGLSALADLFGRSLDVQSRQIDIAKSHWEVTKKLYDAVVTLSQAATLPVEDRERIAGLLRELDEELDNPKE